MLRPFCLLQAARPHLWYGFGYIYTKIQYETIVHFLPIRAWFVNGTRSTCCI